VRYPREKQYYCNIDCKEAMNYLNKYYNEVLENTINRFVLSDISKPSENV